MPAGAGEPWKAPFEAVGWVAGGDAMDMEEFRNGCRIAGLSYKKTRS